MRLSLSLRARPTATLATLLLVGALAAPSAALASPPDHSNAGGNNGGNNGVACDEPPAGEGNPGQGNAGQGNAGEVGNVCDDDRDPADSGDGSSTADPDGSEGDPDTDGTDTDDTDTDDTGSDDTDTDTDDADSNDDETDNPEDPDIDEPDTEDPDTENPDTENPDTGGALCEDLLVTLSPTATDGNRHAVAITSQTLEAGVPGWAAASWQAAPGTTLTAVFARTAAGDVSLPPTATGSAVGIEALTFCGTTSGVPDDGAPEQPPGAETERGTGGGKDTPARPTPGPDTTPRGATPPTTSTTAATAATPASTAPASTPATSATAVEPTEDDADAPEDAEVLGIQLAAAATPDPEPADTQAPAAVADVLPIADERGGAAGLVVGGGLALAALIGLLLIAWRRRHNDTQEVTA